MTETRTCDQCGKHLITHRADARFCDKDCSNAWHNAHRRSGTATDKHLTPVSETEGSRGGNVRSVDEARILQSESKERDHWRLVMEVQIHRTLLSTGYFHTDDLDALEVPPIASEVKGTLINAVRARGYMKSTGVLRKVAHAAANARKAWIYQITAKGRAELPALVTDLEKGIAGVPTAARASSATECTGSGDSGEAGLTGPGSGAGAETPQEPPGPEGAPDISTASPDKQLAGVSAGRPTPQGMEGLEETQKQAGTHSGGSIEPLSLLPDPDPESWAA